MDCVCDPIFMNGDKFVQWIGSVFHVCAYSTRDIVGFICGMCNILFWLFAQMPQVHLNYKNKSGEALSLPFLIIWLLGDILNLFGAIFTQQYGVVLITAIYFILVDIVLVGQVFYYNVFRCGQPKQIDNEEELLEQVEFDDDNDRLSLHTAPATVIEASVVTKDHSVEIDTENSRSSNDSPSPVPTTQPDSTQDSQSAKKNKKSKKNKTTAARAVYTVATILSLGAVMTTVQTATSEQQVDLPNAMPKVIMHNSMDSFNPIARRILTTEEEIYTDVDFDISDLYVSDDRRFSPSELFIAAARAEEAPICDATSELSSGAYLFGVISAWGCGILYVASRIPQIYKNKRRKSVENLSVPLFTFPIIANFLYATSILLPNTTDFGDSAFWEGSFPYLIGSLGTNIFGFIIVYQLWAYHGNTYTPDAVVNSQANASNRVSAQEFQESTDVATSYSGKNMPPVSAFEESYGSVNGADEKI